MARILKLQRLVSDISDQGALGNSTGSSTSNCCNN